MYPDISNTMQSVCCDKDTRCCGKTSKEEGGIQEDSLGDEVLFCLQGLGGRVVRPSSGCSVGFEFQINSE